MGVTHTGILEELEKSNLTKLDQHVNGMMTAVGKKF